MADQKDQQSSYPLAPPHTHARSDTDTEAPAAAQGGGARHHRKKTNRTKCLLYIVLFLIFQTGIILLFTLTVMKIKSPKFRIQSAKIHLLAAAMPPTAAVPSLNGTINAELTVKNTNFGRFKFENSYINLFYRGSEVGRVLVPKGRSNWRSTKKFEVAADVRIGPDELGRDLRSGIVAINWRGKLRGNVRVMMVWKKNRASDMNCSMEIVVESREIRNIVCK